MTDNGVGIPEAYRRRVFDLYRRVRDQGGGPGAWEEWVAARDHLFAAHPQDEWWDFELPQGGAGGRSLRRAVKWFKENW